MRDRLMSFAVACLVAGCVQRHTFEYEADISWSQADAPDVIAVTIDGSNLDQRMRYTYDFTASSYDDAAAHGAFLTFVITTSDGEMHTSPLAMDTDCAEESIVLNIETPSQLQHVTDDVDVEEIDGQVVVGASEGECLYYDGTDEAWAS